MAHELAAVRQDTSGGNGQVQGQLCGQLTVRQAPDPVRAEDARHLLVAQQRDQRLLY
jgi:hypothetical protein